MTDASKETITITRRAVIRGAGLDKYYYVFEWVDGEGWTKKVSKGYAHSTSAYAKLGRLTNLDSQKA